MKTLFFLVLILINVIVATTARAAQESPQSVVFEGRAYDSTDNPLTDASVDFNFVIYNPAKTCILYEETQTAVDLNASSGFFALSVGSKTVGGGKRSGNDPTLTMSQVFQNSTLVVGKDAGGVACNYTPTAGDQRVMVVTIDPSAGPAEALPDMAINSVPQALVAETLQGILPAGFLQVTGNVTQANMVTLTGAGDASALHHHDGRYIASGSAAALLANSYVNGNFGIGTSAPATDIGFGGNAARTIGVNRTTGTTGANLSVVAGAAVAAGTDRAGGDLLLSAGTSTGTATSKIEFKTATAAATGTADNAPTTKMTILGNGNVGIGTTTPTSQLSVAKDINIGGIATVSAPAVSPASEGRIFFDSTLNKFRVSQNGAAYADLVSISSQWITNGSDIYYSTGNVGIGTSAPTTDLSFGGDADRIIGVKRTTGTDGSDLTFTAGGAVTAGTDRAGGDLLFSAGVSTGTGTSKIEFKTATAAATGTADNAPTTKMTILGSGYVGIGTATPTSQLSVAKDINMGGIVTGSAPAVSAADEGRIYYDSTLDKFRVSQSGGAYTDLVSVSQWTTTGSDIYYSTGKVGIGTTAPSTDLSLGGNAARTIAMERHTTADTAGNNLTVSSGSATTGATDKTGGDLLLSSGIATGTGTSKIEFKTATAAATGTTDNAPTTKMTILGSGYVGIGTAAPTSQLSVAKDINVGGIVTGSAPAVSAADEGRIYYDSTLDKFRVSQSGGAYANLVVAGGGGGGPVFNDITDINNSAGGFTLTPSAGNSVTINQNTASTSTTSGALIVNGGTGIAGALNVGGAITSNSNINAASSVAATGGANQNSPSLYVTGNYWTGGGASAVDRWSITNILGTGANPTSTLTFAHPTGSSGTKSYNFTDGNVGIGTTASTTDLSFGGDSARAIAMERHTTADTAGNNLTISSGSATTAATDKAGGDLILSSGISTGTGTSKIQFKTAPAAATGTADNAPTAKMTILGNGNVGIGTATPSDKLNVVGTSFFQGTVGLQANNALLYVLPTYNTGGATDKSAIDIQAMIWTLDQTAGFLNGINSLQTIQGISAPDAASFKSQITMLGGGKTLTRGYGFYSASPAVTAGTVTNYYGLYVEDLVGPTNKWAVYTAGTTPSYFGGNVGIGITAPIVSLDLSSKTDSIRLPSGTTVQRPAAPANGDVRYNSTLGTIEGYLSSAWVALNDAIVGRVNITATPYTITNVQQGIYFSYNNAATGVINLPSIATVSDGWKITIIRKVAQSLTITPDGADTFGNGITTIEMRGQNLQSVTIINNGGSWAITNQTRDCIVGRSCWVTNMIYAGTLNGKQYFTTPGGCTNSGTPTCAGGTDTVTKAWANNSGTTANTATGATNYIDGLAQSATVATNYTDSDAAKFCENMNYAGLTDWYLPAPAELELLYLNRTAIGGFVNSTATIAYWSSTDVSSFWGSNRVFGNGQTDTSNGKTTTQYVRCVRRY